MLVLFPKCPTASSSPCNIFQELAKCTSSSKTYLIFGLGLSSPSSKSPGHFVYICLWDVESLAG